MRRGGCAAPSDEAERASRDRLGPRLSECEVRPDRAVTEGEGGAEEELARQEEEKENSSDPILQCVLEQASILQITTKLYQNY